jgi:hypothetical protein
MAVYSEGRYIDRIAGADLSQAVYHAVVQNADSNNSTGRSVVLASSATDAIFGVLNNGPVAGETASVCGRNAQGTFKVKLGGTVAFGDNLTADANGAAVATTTSGNQVLGVAQEAGVSGQVIEYLVVNQVA